MLWKARLLKPIIPAKGPPIITLDDARKYLLALPEDRHAEPEVQAATQAVLMAGHGEGSIMHAHIGMARLINGPVKRVAREKPDRPWMKRKPMS